MPRPGVSNEVIRILPWLCCTGMDLVGKRSRPSATRYPLSAEKRLRLDRNASSAKSVAQSSTTAVSSRSSGPNHAVKTPSATKIAAHIPATASSSSQTKPSARHSKSKSSVADGMVLSRRKKPHACSFCSFASRYATNLKHHLRSHTGIMPHVCPKCSAGFVRRGHLTEHVKTHNDQPKSVSSYSGITPFLRLFGKEF